MYPRLVFKCPGPLSRPGGTYAHQAVSNDAEKASALAAGWFETLPEAIVGRSNQPVQEPDDEKPPSRDELEQKAAELGIKVDGRWSDKRLSDEITKRL